MNDIKYLEEKQRVLDDSFKKLESYIQLSKEEIHTKLLESEDPIKRIQLCRKLLDMCLVPSIREDHFAHPAAIYMVDCMTQFIADAYEEWLTGLKVEEIREEGGTFKKPKLVRQQALGTEGIQHMLNQMED